MKSEPSSVGPRLPVWDFRGECLLLSGGAHGIGAGVVRHFARCGAEVLFADVDTVGAGQLVEALAAEGHPVHFLEADFTSPEAWAQMRAEAERLGLRPSVVMANVGIGHNEPLGETRVETYDRLLAGNLRSAWLAARELAGPLRERGGGSLLLVGSVMAQFGTPGHVLYGAAKAGLIGLTTSLAVELAPEIRVNLIVPGFILNGPPGPLSEVVPRDAWWAFHERFGAEVARADPPLQPLPVWGAPEDIAQAASYLHTARYVTGTALRVDGGLLCQTPIRPTSENAPWEWTDAMRAWLRERGLPEPP